MFLKSLNTFWKIFSSLIFSMCGCCLTTHPSNQGNIGCFVTTHPSNQGIFREDRTRTRMQTSINGSRDFELFGNLPQDIAINVLSRLGIESIMECKVVCKEWRDLIESPEFGNSQHQRYPRLIVFPRTLVFPILQHRRNFPAAPYKIKESNNNHPLPIVHMGGLSGSVPLVRSSVNGLILLLRRQWTEQQQQHPLLWVCNPITREYVRIPNPDEREFERGLPYPPEYRRYLFPFPLIGTSLVESPYSPPREYGNYNFGFGVSRTSMQYKVVWISQSQCRVYTLGTTGQWRSIAISGLRYNKWNTECAFLGGNLYWLDPPESETQNEISCFDLETEVFTYLSAPPTRQDIQSEEYCYRSFCVFDECLCLCDVYRENGIEIWMKRRGQGDWSKKLAINEQVPSILKYEYDYLFPIKVLEEGEGGDGDGLLLGYRSRELVYYYSIDNGGGGTRTLSPFNPPRSFLISPLEYPNAAIFTSSFLPLTTLFADEDVGSF